MHPFRHFFVAEYGEAYAAEREAESSRRAEAFLDVARPVAGVPLRPFTPHDLLILDGFASPFVCGHPGEATPEHFAAVLWMLRAGVPPGWRGRVAHRLHCLFLRLRWRSRARLLEDYAAMRLWFDDVFADSGMPTEPGAVRRLPVGTHFLSGLLLSLACEIGAIDPASGKPLIEAPLARLFQYGKNLRARAESEKFVEVSSADRLKAQALDRWNKMSPEEKAVWEELSAVEG